MLKNILVNAGLSSGEVDSKNRGYEHSFDEEEREAGIKRDGKMIWYCRLRHDAMFGAADRLMARLCAEFPSEAEHPIDPFNPDAGHHFPSEFVPPEVFFRKKRVFRGFTILVLIVAAIGGVGFLSSLGN
ncbi:hypothetical protein [Rhodovulum sp. P5]|uniref:hypothetical protein n=1 Tax=Rhodovulum sp. P5 TaxID=1564506 RepID=UPI0012EBDCBC|nr:hypothetical protein [Rhodovulum sp. P5]